MYVCMYANSMLLPFTLVPPSTTSFMSSHHPSLPSFWLRSSSSLHPSCPRWTSTEGLINVLPGIIITHADSPSNTIHIWSAPSERRRIKNVQDALSAARLPASECIKYPASIPHTHIHTHKQRPSPPYLYTGSRHHQWIAFMQNASITGKTKRPCQGRGVVTGAGKRFYTVLIWAAISP